MNQWQEYRNRKILRRCFSKLKDSNVLNQNTFSKTKIWEITDDFYETKEYIDTSDAHIKIYCHCKTDIYNALVGCGILMHLMNHRQIKSMKYKKFMKKMWGFYERL